MKSVVYIVPLTPEAYLNPLRSLLRNTTIKSLNGQLSDDWEALFVGEFDKTEGNIHYIPAVSLEPGYEKRFRADHGHTDKHFKIDVAMQYIARQQVKPKYVVRLDDDDIVSPNIVSIITGSNGTYDCFADRWQCLAYLYNGKICFTNLPWMPNTVFHKYEHAKTIIPEFDLMLVNTSHGNGFHNYYSDKKVWYSEKGKPFYIRTLSPTSYNLVHRLEAGAKTNLHEHAKKFGFWQYKLLPEYEPYLSQLYKDAGEIIHRKITRNYSSLYRAGSFLSYYWHRRFDNLPQRILAKLGVKK